jgi:glucan phosphoethanolaminetransferase (alkaline phosphatase superfamily)
MDKDMTAKELLKRLWFWFVALFTIPAFAGWLGYFSHTLAAPHMHLAETAIAWAGWFALIALTPWIAAVCFCLLILIFGGRG